MPSAIAVGDRLDFRITICSDLDKNKKDSEKDKWKIGKVAKDKKFRKKKNKEMMGTSSKET